MATCLLHHINQAVSYDHRSFFPRAQVPRPCLHIVVGAGQIVHLSFVATPAAKAGALGVSHISAGILVDCTFALSLLLLPVRVATEGIDARLIIDVFCCAHLFAQALFEIHLAVSRNHVYLKFR